jgi:hypothetical protein
VAALTTAIRTGSVLKAYAALAKTAEPAGREALLAAVDRPAAKQANAPDRVFISPPVAVRLTHGGHPILFRFAHLPPVPALLAHIGDP